MARALSSSYSRFDTHIFLKVSNDARMEPLQEDRTGQDGYTFYIKGHILRRAHNSTLEAEFLPDPCGVEPLLGSRDLNRKKETAGHKHTILQRTQHKL